MTKAPSPTNNAVTPNSLIYAHNKSTSDATFNLFAPESPEKPTNVIAAPAGQTVLLGKAKNIASLTFHGNYRFSAVWNIPEQTLTHYVEPAKA